MKKFSQKLVLSSVVLCILSACGSTPRGVQVKDSYLTNADKNTNRSTVLLEKNKSSQKKVDFSGFTYLSAADSQRVESSEASELELQFDESHMVKLSIDTLLIRDFLHYVYGETLGINYILGQELSESKDKITLNFQKELSKRELFEISRDILEERGVTLRTNDGVLYIHKDSEGTANNFVYGYGNLIEDVPNTSNEIIQIAPYQAGVQASLAGTIKQLTRIDVRQLFEQKALLIKGKRRDVIKALEFMHLMDQPAFRNRQVAMYKAEFVSSEELSKDLLNLLKQDGISASLESSDEQAVSVVPIQRTNTLIFFSNDKRYLSRVAFWSEQLDKPADGNEKQFFIFEPEFARAVDLGQSLQRLFGQGSARLTASTSARGQNESNQQDTSAQPSNVAVKSDDLNMVVDERSNSLIFETTGEKYRSLLPLIKRLDVLPKQVVLEVLIAEVKLTDIFKQGVTFALSNLGADITGGFSLESKSDTGLTYSLKGASGNIALNLLETNSNVNVLSRPTLAVRDGVAANINVGDKIPVVGEIITSPDVGSQTSVNYLDTGIELTVTPTVNAQGVVLMEIEQKISSQSTSGSGAGGNPIILDRALKTEVIAGDGQTVMLGGLIDEKSTYNDRRVPFFSDIPLLGKVFDGTDNNVVKTELVVFVTPRIVQTTDNWDSILNEFKQTLMRLEVTN
ncbi:secretin N-terminal domain-containing protein [Pseudoalteromonas piscicida]|uniref:secretin N-terminal domain-containing protein n=1 Tax=Pseudoalteromonas piscicida TaxID=43662 RepID=UPI00026CEADD|nr:secretin N-terminal domain-containing protein [Pseudoalteromonas piscicida]WPU30917.1 secretin N-terminal domain-containing protein [Pseudoalteromonas piscicida]